MKHMYHPSEQSPVVSALSPPWLQLFGTNSTFSVCHSTSVSSFKSSLKTLFFLETFFQFHCPYMQLVHVHMRAYVRVCVLHTLNVQNMYS